MSDHKTFPRPEDCSAPSMPRPQTPNTNEFLDNYTAFKRTSRHASVKPTSSPPCRLESRLANSDGAHFNAFEYVNTGLLYTTHSKHIELVHVYRGALEPKQADCNWD